MSTASIPYIPAPDPADRHPGDWRGRRGRFTARAVPGGNCYVANDASVVGAVELGPEASVWFQCVLRGDDAPIRVGARTNVQDLTMIHADPGELNEIGSDCVIGHRVVLHGSRVGDKCLIGMGAILLGGSSIGDGSVVGAGTVVKEGMVVPPRSLIVGVPGRIIRTVPDDVIEQILRNVDGYIQKAKLYL
jgi:carbonic anhydrase/acetyltransferase-like protein (isoleucine patch superfamily)